MGEEVELRFELWCFLEKPGPLVSLPCECLDIGFEGAVTIHGGEIGSAPADLVARLLDVGLSA